MLLKIKKQLAEILSQEIKVESDQICGLLENPKQFDHGHLALPVFFLAKIRKQAPPLIAKEIAGKIEGEFIQKVEAVGGFVNFTFKSTYLQDILMDEIHGAALGASAAGAGKKILIDYSSPNVAKPMSIGHLRATVIGQALRNLAESQGYEVIGLNHLGDWGSQFGKLAWAIQEWGDEYPLDEKPIDSLLKLYVRFHDQAEKDPELDHKGAATFKKLEEGDREIEGLWKKIVDLSLDEYQRLWDLLGVKHDLVRGESFYNDRLESTVQRIEEKGILEKSEGADVVFVDENMPPCLIRKSDGASLYATRDIASALYRHEELKANLNLYVVGVDQSLHFKQIFKVLEKMEYPWAADCHHIAFGMYRFKDIGKMSTRKGNVIFLEDVLNKAIDGVKSLIEEKNPSLENKDEVARQVGVGAVIFNDLLNDRVRNVDFDWDRVLDFEGDSGPYVQYTQVRCKSVIRKYGKEVPKKIEHPLEEREERFLISLLLRFQDVLSISFSQFKPNILAQYLLEVCRAYSHFYHKCRILGEDEKIERSRIALTFAAQRVLVQGLKTLNIESPEMM